MGTTSSRSSGTIPTHVNEAYTTSILSDSSFGAESSQYAIQNGMPLWFGRFKKAGVVAAAGILEHSYKDLQKVTHNFSSLIGHGAYGPVYKAQISTGDTVAVKVLATNSKQGEKEFQNEVPIIMWTVRTCLSLLVVINLADGEYVISEVPNIQLSKRVTIP